MSSSSNLHVYDVGVRHRYNLHAYIVHARACRLPSRRSTLCRAAVDSPHGGDFQVFSTLFRASKNVRLFVCITKIRLGRTTEGVTNHSVYSFHP